MKPISVKQKTSQSVIVVKERRIYVYLFQEHTEQTIHLAQVLQKFIWNPPQGGTFSHLLQEAGAFQNPEKMALLAASGAANSLNFGLSSSGLFN